MLNNVSLVGRLTKDPETKVIGENSVAVCNFTIAVNRNYKDKDGENQADFILCQAWKGQAEFLASYVKKSHLVALTGSINTRSYDDDNAVRHYITEINVSSVTSLEKKPQADASAHNYKSLDEVKRARKTEWDMKSVGLDSASKQNLQNEIDKKYQPIIDQFETDSPY